MFEIFREIMSVISLRGNVTKMNMYDEDYSCMEAVLDDGRIVSVSINIKEEVKEDDLV